MARCCQMGRRGATSGTGTNDQDVVHEIEWIK